MLTGDKLPVFTVSLSLQIIFGSVEICFAVLQCDFYYNGKPTEAQKWKDGGVFMRDVDGCRDGEFTLKMLILACLCYMQ